MQGLAVLADMSAVADLLCLWFATFVAFRRFGLGFLSGPVPQVYRNFGRNIHRGYCPMPTSVMDLGDALWIHD